MTTWLWVVAAHAQATPTDEVRTAQNVATGDLDGDGWGDVVFGDRHAGSWSGCSSGYGAIEVRYGLDPTVGEVLERVGGELTGARTCGSGLGAGIAMGDVDGDGFDDLAVGLPGAAQVQVVYGSGGGLDLSRQATLSALPTDGPASELGAALAAGDLDCDGFADLAVGLPGANTVGVLAGGPTGVTDPGIRLSATSATSGSRFGAAVAIGDLDRGLGCADLAIGAPRQDVGAVGDAGAVHVSYGRPGALGPPTRLLTQSGPTSGQELGWKVTIGDVGADGVQDLLVELRAAGTVLVYAGGTLVAGGQQTQSKYEQDLAKFVMLSQLVCGASGVNGLTLEPDCDACCGTGCCLAGSCEAPVR